jgi:uncharacterized protein (DUF952 family)
MFIYHIVVPEVWESVGGRPFYEAESLATEGFIHCSFAGQLDAVLDRYYSGAKSVIILKIDPSALTSDLVEEPSTNNEIYPHIYGKINRGAIVEISERVLR